MCNFLPFKKIMTDRQTDQQTHIMAYMEVTNNCSSKNCIKKGKERELKVGGGGGVKSAEETE